MLKDLCTSFLRLNSPVQPTGSQTIDNSPRTWVRKAVGTTSGSSLVIVFIQRKATGNVPIIIIDREDQNKILSQPLVALLVIGWYTLLAWLTELGLRIIPLVVEGGEKWCLLTSLRVSKKVSVTHSLSYTMLVVHMWLCMYLFYVYGYMCMWRLFRLVAPT